jgi:hypothetical protein
MLFASLTLFPFVKRRKTFTRNLFIGASLFFTILLFNHIIQLPLLFVIPIMPWIKIFFTFSFAYFAYFFTVFLSDKEILYFYNLIETQEDLSEARLAKHAKWRKMFIYSLLTVTILFLGTSVYMVFSNTFERSFIGKINLYGFVNKALKDVNQIADIRNNSTSPAENRRESVFKNYTFKNISFKALKGLNQMKKQGRLLLYKKENNKKLHVITIESRPLFYSTEIYMKQLALSRYISYAKNGQNNIVAKFFITQMGNNTGCYITSGNFREIMILYPRNKDLILFYALLSKTTSEYIPEIIKSLNVSGTR